MQYESRDEWAAAVRATEIATEAYKAVDDEAGVHNAATLRAAAEIELAAAMNAGTQRAEQRALVRQRRSAPRRRPPNFSRAHGLPVRAQYAVNMRAVLAVSTGDYDAGGKLLAQSVEMARANNDVAEQAKSLANLAAVHNYRGYMAQAAKEYEALLPLHRSAGAAVSIRRAARQLRLHADRTRRFRPRAGAAHEALELYTKIGEEGRTRDRTGGARRAVFPHGRRRARARNPARRDRRTGAASATMPASRARCASPPTRPRCSGQHDAALDYLRKSAQIDANPHSVARTRVLHRDGTARRRRPRRRGNRTARRR